MVEISITIQGNNKQTNNLFINDNNKNNLLNLQIFTNGITNKLIGVYYSGHYSEMLLIRIYGNKTDLLIDRKDEVRNIRVSFSKLIISVFKNN